MKNILTVIVAATAFFNINAETLTLTPGSISAEIAADAVPAKLIIKGEIDIRDFDYIRDNFWRTLRTLDLSEARIAAYEGEADSDRCIEERSRCASRWRSDARLAD